MIFADSAERTSNLTQWSFFQISVLICLIWTAQKGVYYTGIKLFNSLPRNIKEIVGSPKQLKITLRRYMVTHFFYDLVEYYQVNE
jgi:hypothetical protein